MVASAGRLLTAIPEDLVRADPGLEMVFVSMFASVFEHRSVSEVISNR